VADLLQTLLIAVVLGSLYALIALGYTLVFGVLKLINFAHSDVVALGAWSSLALATMLLPFVGIDPLDAPWWAAAFVLVASMLLCGAVGFAIERLAYRPIRRAPRLNALITAIGVSLLLSNVGQLQYTLRPNEAVVARGDLIERKPGQNAKAVRLSVPLTIEPGSTYEVAIARRGDPTTAAAATQATTAPAAAVATLSSAAVRRTIAAPPGTYAAGTEIAVAETVGRTQTVNAVFSVVRRSDKPAVRLPFGNKPASMPPGLVPVDRGETVAAARREVTQSKTVEVLPGPAVLLQLNLFDRGPVPPDGGERPRIYKPVKLTTVDATIVATSVLLMLGLEFVIFRTRLGAAMRAVSYNIDTAALMGIPVDRIVSVTFVGGTMLAAAAGFMYALRYQPIYQTADNSWVLLGLKAFVAAVVGGIGNVRGAAVGGFLIAAVEQFGAFAAQQAGWDKGSALTDVFVFALLILVLLVKPTGLFGTGAREKV